MTDNYYILTNGEQTGPFTLHELIQMDLNVDTKVQSPEYDGWQKASDLPELFEYFEAQGIYFPTDDNLAGFWWRLLAYIIDTVLLSFLIDILVPDMVMKLSKVQFSLNPTPEVLVLRLQLTLIAFAISTIYNATLEASPMQGSLGKKLCRIMVVDEDGRRLSFLRAFGRNLGKFVSSLVLWVGYFNVLWDTHKQAWHDQWAKTYVIIRNR